MTSTKSKLHCPLHLLSVIVAFYDRTDIQGLLWNPSEEALRRTYLMLLALLDEMLDFGYPSYADGKSKVLSYNEPSVVDRSPTRAIWSTQDGISHGGSQSQLFREREWSQDQLEYQRKNEILSTFWNVSMFYFQIMAMFSIVRLTDAFR
jgi:hypothetical protein